jgi:hypothetical protein
MHLLTRADGVSCMSRAADRTAWCVALQMVGLYTKWMIPGLLPFIWSLVIMKVVQAKACVGYGVLPDVLSLHLVLWLVQTLQAQTIMWPPAIVTAISALINIPVNLILIRLYGFTGAAAAFSVTRVIMFLLLVGGHFFRDVLCQMFGSEVDTQAGTVVLLRVR